jgi:hypothetical protein
MYRVSRYGREFSLQQRDVECSQLKSYLFRDLFSAAAPIVWTEGDDLFLKTSFFQYALNLFAYSKIIKFSKARKVMEIRTKKWWRWGNPVRMPFSEIDFLDLTFEATNAAEGEQPIENYNLFMVTKHPSRKIELFRFSGDSSTGPRYRRMAEGCADLIEKLTNIRSSLHKTFDMPFRALHKTNDISLPDFNDKYVCAACGHQVHPESGFILCPYCGGKEIRIE